MLERDGLKLLGGDPATADRALDRIAALEAKLALVADQFADDLITGDQFRRVTERLKPQLTTERARLAAAQPDPGLTDYAGADVATTWAKADLETRRHIIRFLGVGITIRPVGSGNGRVFDPESVSIDWQST